MAEDLLQDMRSVVYQCDRCGACLAACPLYAVTGREVSVARGKNAIARAILEKGITVNTDVKKAFDFCLLCKACTANCPNKVETDEAMILARRYVAQKMGIRLSHRLIGYLMQNNMLLNVAAQFIALAKRTGIGKLVSPLYSEGCSSLYRSILQGPAGVEQAVITNSEVVAGKKVAYYQGCAMKLLFPEVAKSSVAVLAQISEVAVPESVCCGMPHSTHGMGETAKRLAQNTIEAFTDFDIVVTDCASCGSVLKTYARQFATDKDWKDKANRFSSKVMGFSQYLVAAGYNPSPKNGLTVTYHDPCHLSRGQDIKNPPRMLLRQAGDYRELAKADLCCGGAGTFQLDFPQMSEKILQEKRIHIANTGATVVATECPACMMQLSKGIKNQPYRVMHISQVLDE